MDHQWDGFYTSQLRTSRFPGILTTGEDYTIEITSTPPEKMRFKLEGEQGGIKIKINYPVAGSIQVYADDVAQDYTAWDEALGSPGPLPKTTCGDNRFVGVENFLEFYLEPGCVISIEPKEAIQTKVRMDWSIADFYSNGGVVSFTDKLASTLGIASFRVKIVAVYTGTNNRRLRSRRLQQEDESTVVDFTIAKKIVSTIEGEEVSEEEAQAELEVTKQTLVTKVAEATIDVGASVSGL